jgi:hypothetical protein
MTPADWAALEANPLVTIAANGSHVDDRHTDGGHG